MAEQIFVSNNEAAKMLAISLPTFYRRIYPHLEARKIGAKTVWFKADIERFADGAALHPKDRAKVAA